MNDEALQHLRLKLEFLERFLRRHELKPEDSPVDWSNDRALESIYGSALSDDPPEGWGAAKLAQFARGRSYGENILAGNALEHLHFIMDILNRPEMWTNEALAKRWGLTDEKRGEEK